MEQATKYPPLTEFLVHYSDGEVRPTAMAAHVTLADAQNYFVGVRFEITETTFHTCTKVEKIDGPCSLLPRRR